MDSMRDSGLRPFGAEFLEPVLPDEGVPFGCVFEQDPGGGGGGCGDSGYQTYNSVYNGSVDTPGPPDS